ncbi:MAG: (2Fe-2S) ferredoxin domain-containing protein [Anaerolineae bacterium]|nr:(2Fe-2S) ferredoxin domain-containing protein [Anaerolineae bacterium]
MPKLKSLDDLRRLREEAQHELTIRQQTETKITVGMGTCGIAAGARETMQAILKELESREIEAHVATVGCIGMCSKEPLVDVEQAGKPRITYANVHPDMVPRLIREHLVEGRVVEEWAFGRVPPGGIGATSQTER